MILSSAKVFMWPWCCIQSFSSETNNQRAQHLCVILTAIWLFWCLYPAQPSSGYVPPSRSGVQQSCYEPGSWEGPHQLCKQKALVIFIRNATFRTFSIKPSSGSLSRMMFSCLIKLQHVAVMSETYVLVSLASWCMSSRIMRQAAEQPSGVEWMLIGFSAAPAFSLRCTSILQQQKVSKSVY